jgi:putative FmdB family regulatory protein
MPIYAYKCDMCEIDCDITKPMAKSDAAEECPECGEDMHRDYGSEQVNAGNTEYASPKMCDSLAIVPSQIEGHRKLHPDVKVAPDGRIQFESTKQEDEYYTKRGVYKRPQQRKKYRMSK